MKYLLDVSTLLARLWESHVFHERTTQWMEGKPIAVCAITELGFLRISVSAFGADMDHARQMLGGFLNHYRPEFIHCDLRVLDGTKATSGAKTTDFYLADLAHRHEMQWATLDESTNHKSAFVIPAVQSPPVQPASDER